MATIVYAMLMSLDGYVTGPKQEFGLPIPQAELHRHFNQLMRQTSVALYGRRMYEVMRYWDSPEREQDADEVEVDFAHAWRETPKLVFSTTLREVGPNARLVSSDAMAVVRSLKSESDGEISVAGPTLAAELARSGLIDEYRLYQHPVVLGGGKPYFQLGLSLQLKSLGSEKLPQGVTLLRYAPVGP
ncbi:dihydrofolate reductase family protein [Labrys sp. KNU-23]|uniref:dihydrofolate reductase family protein n=1 Tax=Labrys sp. KNU-23 TaxID=2789216 RepID=UPI0011F047D7|nr:dihydrofolate reductase family protein [Labrys sp. KNU-23]QEN87214.1 dihydrofolate reductase family protein [Labrys sp. KNU-23]